MRCHLREGIYGTGDFHLLHQSSAVPADLRVFPSVSGRKFPYGEIFCRKNASKARVTDGKVDSEGENCDRRSACATREKLSGAPFHAVSRHETAFLFGCGEGSPAPSALHVRVVCPYPRPPVLPAFSLGETACRNGRRDTNFSGYGGTFRKIHRTFVHRTNNNRITVKRTWLKLKSRIQK